jgi:hypothetical protein
MSTLVKPPVETRDGVRTIRAVRAGRGPVDLEARRKAQGEVQLLATIRPPRDHYRAAWPGHERCSAAGGLAGRPRRALARSTTKSNAVKEPEHPATTTK